MKRILLLLALCFLPAFAFAQNGDFQLEADGSLVWRKVITYAADAQTVSYNLKADGHFRNIEVMSDDLVTAELVNLFLKIDKDRYNKMKLPVYIYNDIFSGMVTIELKENRYRVTVSRIMTTNPHYGKGPLDNLATKNGEFKAQFLGDPSKIISENFDDLFYPLARKISSDDEW